MSTHDRQGKRALFTGAGESSQPESGRAGKAALYSAANRRPATLVVECSSCHGRSRVSYVDFAMRQLPVTLWLPWRHHSRFMTCPACGRRTWLAAHWFD